MGKTKKSKNAASWAGASGNLLSQPSGVAQWATELMSFKPMSMSTAFPLLLTGFTSVPPQRSLPWTFTRGLSGSATPSVNAC